MEIEIEDLHIQMEDVVKAKMSVSLCPEGVTCDAEWNRTNCVPIILLSLLGSVLHMFPTHSLSVL